MDKIMEEYAIDEDSTGIAIHSLDGSISWTLNEDELYTGASLYKLPLAMIWYDRLEKDPSLLKSPCCTGPTCTKMSLLLPHAMRPVRISILKNFSNRLF
ncbi:hypothetical protein [Allobaculum sp. Allo2]|uniref:hypothetical protein n=1 Tax=Allobaculum sp. Allo2 TaxID=2853432 RepID=UPI001F6185C8|nr:hypothetical protein [Allobaculum sp. Allo2]UNT93557.1 hypothetical protein KWG61_01840 [Allobaculum sp. Allo2]